MSRRVPSSAVSEQSTVIGSTTGTVLVLRTYGEAGLFNRRSFPWRVRVYGSDGSSTEDMTATGRATALQQNGHAFPVGRSYTVTRGASPLSNIAEGGFLYLLDAEGDIDFPETVSVPMDTGPQGPPGPQGASGPAGATGPAGAAVAEGEVEKFYMSNVNGRAWYGTTRGVGQSAVGSLNPAAHTGFLVPLWVPRSVTFDRIGVHILNAGAGSSLRLGLYDADDNGFPDVRLLDAGTVDTSTTGGKEIVISHSVGAGLYWMAMARGFAGTAPSVFCGVSASPLPLGATSILSAAWRTYLRDAVGFPDGSFPANINPSNLESPGGLLMPALAVRVV